MTAGAIRIAALNFVHETVTFLQNDTTLDDFRYEGSPARCEGLLGWDPKGYMGGFVKVAREFDQVELVGIESPLWPKTGTGSGWITTEAWEHFTGRMITDLTAQGPFDGVFLALHGAMGVRGVPRPEAELARRVREVVGPDAFLSATFDPHGNEDDEFLTHADMGFAVKYYPHYDAYLQGERAARTLVRAIRGDYVPTTATVEVPIITPTVVQWTGASPWLDLVHRALTWEAREPDVYVNVFFGFPWADVPDVGMTFQVLTNDDPALARQVADDMAATAWRRRAELVSSTRVHRIAEGLDQAATAVAEGRTPVVLADHSDRSGYATWILREVVERDLARTLLVTVADKPLVDRMVQADVQVGDAFDEEVGGLADESAGAPVRIRGTVTGVHAGVGRAGFPAPDQRWFNVSFGRGNVVVISPFLVQVVEPEVLAHMDLDVADFDAIAIKSRVHFRRGFDDSGFAPTILLVEPDEPFLGTVRLEGLPYRNVDLSRYYPYGEPEFP